MFDSNACLSLINQAAQSLFTDYEIKLGIPLARGAGYDELISLLEETYSTQKLKTGEILWPDHRTFAAVITPIENGGCVVILHDVTHFKDLERVKNEFISTASHDLKNPIAVISGFSDLLPKVGPLNETQAGFVEHIHSAASNMNELVQNLLELAKIDMGLNLKKETVDINSLVSEIKDEFQPQMDAKGQKLLLKESANQPKVQADLLQLKQAIRNLLGNANKYTSAGGSIELLVEKGERSVAIFVKDTGYGIPADDLPFIFDRFYRVRNDDVRDIEGNGLGLAIVKSIIEAHGGQISVESESGKGSCFVVSLPLMQPELPPVEDADLSKPAPVLIPGK
jgi:signal transduction histidine kinase